MKKREAAFDKVVADKGPITADNLKEIQQAVKKEERRDAEAG